MLFGEMTNLDPPAVQNQTIRITDKISYLAQKPLILGGSILENILLDLPEDKTRLAWALKYSALDDDLKILEDGLKTKVGEQGVTLSGGQKVRLA